MKEQHMAKLAINKSLLKEYNNSSDERIVYMNDNTEFQIQLFNPKPYNIGITIYLNNQKLDNQLVLYPGQRIWLERYLDTAKKFKFETYEVENTDEVKEAIKNNGKIKIEFYNERQNNYNNSISITYTDNGWIDNCNKVKEPEPLKIDWPRPSCDPYFYITNCYTATSDCGITTSASSLITSELTSSYSNDNIYKANFETGRIGKGSKSSQQFNDVDIVFDLFPFTTEYIQILPMSQKKYTASDLKKKYCSNCGRKIKDKFKFCPFCGEKL